MKSPVNLHTQMRSALSKVWNGLWIALGIYFVGNFVGSVVFAFASLKEPEELGYAVYEPLFVMDDDEIYAGKAFVAEAADCPNPLLISASHLFGPAGGYHAQLDPQGIQTKTQRYELYSLMQRDTVENTARSLTPQSGAGDMVAFAAPANLAEDALALADTLPDAGTRVWVITEIYNGNPAIAHEAVVWGMEDGSFFYDFVDHDYNYQATSGAPVIDNRGQVIAINLGGGKNKDGTPYGYGNPVTTWGPLLSEHCESVYASL